MAYVFISYSHKDKEYARQLADEMKRRGIEVWIDDRIEYGDVWTRVIQENLERCQAMILIMTSNAYNSEWVQNELAFAQQIKKPILPLLLEGRSWLSLASTQYADVQGGKMPPGTFFERTKRHLGRSAVTAQPKIEKQPAKISTEEILLRAIIFQRLKESVGSEQPRTWQIGLFNVNFSRLSYTKQESYVLSCEVTNENLLRQYDPSTYAEYTANREVLNIKRNKLEKQGSSLKAILDAYTAPLIDLLHRLNLDAGNTWMHKPTDVELQRSAEQLIYVHKVHHIPIDAIKVQVLNM
jgi:hypothetical protein